jgi:hypothetical protein
MISLQKLNRLRPRKICMGNYCHTKNISTTSTSSPLDTNRTQNQGKSGGGITDGGDIISDTKQVSPPITSR